MNRADSNVDLFNRGRRVRLRRAFQKPQRLLLRVTSSPPPSRIRPPEAASSELQAWQCSPAKRTRPGLRELQVAASRPAQFHRFGRAFGYGGQRVVRTA